MRRRTFWQRARSNNEREGLGYSRYAALWRQFDYGRRRDYRHSDHWEYYGSRRWKRAMEIVSPPDRRILRRADPRVFYQSPGRAKTDAEREAV